MNRVFGLRHLGAVVCVALALVTTAASGVYQSLQLQPQAEHEALVANTYATSGSCGVERWSVKVGTDPDAPLVNLNNPVAQTISYLRGLTAPASPPLNARVQPAETTDFVVDATLIQYKLENDSDYHLVIKDAAGNTMIAEVPDPACVASSSSFVNQIKSARAQFDAKYTASSSFQTANIPVRLSGVAFFDFLHGQTGVAPNGIELHPLLNIDFNPGTGGSADFALSAAPSTVSVSQGSSITSTISIVPTNGFTGNVTFAASGMPAGVTASFSPTSSPSATTLRLTASASATTGPITMAVAGSNGSLTHNVLLNLTVNAAGGGTTAVYNSTLKTPWCGTIGSTCDSGPSLLLGRGTLSGGTEPNQPNTINGTCADGNSGTFHSDESNDRLVIASTDGGPLTAGKTVRVTATVWVYNTTTDALDLYSAANANSPSWTFLNTITPAATGAQTLTTTFVLPAGGLQAIRAHFRYQGSAAACSTGAYDESDDLVFAVSSPTASPDFAVSAAPSSLTVSQGATGTSTVSVASLNGFSGATSLSASGLPSGVTATFAPGTVTPAAGGSANATLSLAASSTAPTGASTVTLTGTSGSITHTASVLLSVTASSGGGTLSNGVAKTGLAGAAGSDQVFTLAVPSGATGLKFVTGGGTGDSDLYVKFGSPPTTTVNDCKSEGSTTAETCSIATAQAGTYYVLVHGYASFSGVSLTGSYNTSGGGCTPSGTTLCSGTSVALPSVATGGVSANYTLSVPAGKTSVVFTVSGGTGDADMYVNLGSAPTSTTYTCRPYLTGNNETCTINAPAAGMYYINVRAYAGYSGVSLTATVN
jgi:hypothetical protein